MGGGFRGLLRDFAIFAVGIILLTVFWGNNVLATAIVIAVFALRMSLAHERGDITLFLVGAVLGSAAEVVGTHAGIWEYANPSFLNIPLWLPFAWGFATVLIVRIGQNLAGLDSGHDKEKAA